MKDKNFELLSEQHIISQVSNPPIPLTAEDKLRLIKQIIHRLDTEDLDNETYEALEESLWNLLDN